MDDITKIKCLSFFHTDMITQFFGKNKCKTKQPFNIWNKSLFLSVVYKMYKIVEQKKNNGF